MRKKIALTFFLVLVLGMVLGGLTTWVTAAGSTVPSKMNFQGFLTDPAGQPLSGNYTLTFSIYDVPTGGTPLWSENQTVTVQRGIFNVMLGSQTPLSFTFPDTSYLGVKVGADAEMLPRREIASVPYAIQARNAYMLDGRSASEFLLNNALSTGGSINDPSNPVDWTKLKNVPPDLAGGVVKQLVQDFVVAAGQNVTAGDVVGFLNGYVRKGVSTSGDVFNQASTGDTSAATLSPTEFVVAYRDLGNAGHGTALIGDVSGNNTITYGSEYVFNPADSDPISVATLSSTKFVVAYRDAGNSGFGTAVIGDVSGSTIAYGSEYVFNLSETFELSVAALSPTEFVVTYQDWANSQYGTAVIGDVSGNAIAYGSECVFNPDATLSPSVATLSSTRFVVSYKDIANSGYAMAVIGDVSGNTTTCGPENVFNPGDTYGISVAALSSTKFVVTYRDFDNAGLGTAVIGDVSGNTTTRGQEYVFNPASTSEPSVAALSPTKFVVTYGDGGNSDYGTAIIGSVSGTVITYGSEYVFNPANAQSSSIAMLSLTKFVVTYDDVGNSNHATAVIGDVSGSAITFPDFIEYLIGIAGESGTAGQTVPVIIAGVSDVHSSLNAGSIYYVTGLGDLTTDVTLWRVGLAISPTEILLDLDRWTPYLP